MSASASCARRWRVRSNAAKRARACEQRAHVRPLRADGKPIPTELRSGEAGLRHQIELEDDVTAVPKVRDAGPAWAARARFSHAPAPRHMWMMNTPTRECVTPRSA